VKESDREEKRKGRGRHREETQGRDIGGETYDR
jgi:hypothetical protein